MRILLFLSLALTKDYKSDFPIDLSVYDGKDGLLIDWSFDEKITIKIAYGFNVSQEKK